MKLWGRRDDRASQREILRLINASLQLLRVDAVTDEFVALNETWYVVRWKEFAGALPRTLNTFKSRLKKTVHDPFYSGPAYDEQLSMHRQSAFTGQPFEIGSYTPQGRDCIFVMMPIVVAKQMHAALNRFLSEREHGRSAPAMQFSHHQSPRMYLSGSQTSSSHDSPTWQDLAGR